MSHAIERAWERYGVDLTTDDMARIAADVAARSLLVFRIATKPDGAIVVAVYVADRWLPFLCDTRGYVITTLPYGHLMAFKRELDNRRRSLIRSGLIADPASRERNAG